jgi:hypothetical protein
MSLDHAREVLRENYSEHDTSGYALAVATIEIAEQLRIANLIAVQHIEFLAGNKHFEAKLWNEHIGPALGFIPRGVREPSDAGADRG